MKTMYALTISAALLFSLPMSAFAQSDDGSSSAITSSLKSVHELTSTNVIKTAEMLDEELYAYQPTPEVRTMGELLAHIAGAQFMFCSAADGTDSPSQENFEETAATSKEEIIAALEESTEYCSSVYEGMTDEAGATMRPIFGMEMAASAILAFNTAHNYEHYGNLVTYMRMNDIVPPSSM